MEIGASLAYMPMGWSQPPKAALDSQPSQPVSISPTAATETSPESNNSEPNSSNTNNTSDSNDLREEAKARQQQQAYDQVIAQLQARDREVRAHEQAHLAAAGPYATGGIQYDYQTGPDGNQYAVGGSVGIDTSPIPGDPEATIQKMQVVQRAALAPAEPSGQDIKVAAQAAQQATEARVELQAERAEELNATEEDDEENDIAQAQTNLNTPNEPTPFGLASNNNLERNSFDIRLQLQNA